MPQRSLFDPVQQLANRRAVARSMEDVRVIVILPC
jgi:hypothetical protein